MIASAPLRLLGLGLVVVLLCWTLPAWAGYTQPEGAYYLKVWNRTLVGSRALLSDGSIEGIGETYQDYALNLYVEYGLTDDWTLLAAGRPVGFAAVGGESALYVGQLTAGVRRSLLRGPTRLALEGRYGYAPDVGTDPLVTGVIGDEPFTYAPAVATHNLDAELQLAHGFDRVWVGAFAGMRWFSADGLDPALLTRAAMGYTAPIGLGVDFSVAYYQPLGDVTFTNVSGAGQTRFFGFTIEGRYQITRRWSVNAGFGGVVYAESNAATPALTLGFAVTD